MSHSIRENLPKNVNFLGTQFCKLSTEFIKACEISLFREKRKAIIDSTLLGKRYLTFFILHILFFKPVHSLISYITHYLLLHYNRLFTHLQPYFCPI
jgi:hypothetical protein